MIHSLLLSAPHCWELAGWTRMCACNNYDLQF